MTLTLSLPDKFRKTLDIFSTESRRGLFSVAAENLHRTVVSHLERIKPRHHKWSKMLGAAPTDHFGKGIGGASFESDSDSAAVVVPLPGLNRAFRDMYISPVSAKYLTLPASAHSYGRRAAEMKRMGWRLFRPGSRRVLMGYAPGEKKNPVPLYALKDHVLQRQDRSLLPSDDALAASVKDAMRKEIVRIHKL